jgi:DNA-binding response OmpR family regulator
LATSNEGPATILVADDNPILLQGLDRALSASGYAVETAGDGAEVLELLARSPSLPDLLLLDVMMPKLSGLEVLRRLQADARWSGVPVVLVTAMTDETLPARALEGGAVDVLIKPFRLNELLGRIDSHVRRSRSAEQVGIGVECDPASR